MSTQAIQELARLRRDLTAFKKTEGLSYVYPNFIKFRLFTLNQAHHRQVSLQVRTPEFSYWIPPQHHAIEFGLTYKSRFSTFHFQKASSYPSYYQ